MPWYEKDHRTPLDDMPINGLSFLYGDVVALQYKEEWVRGKKYPIISFPSNTTRELIPGDATTAIHLFGQITLVHSTTRDEAYHALLSHPQALDYRMTRVDEHELLVKNPSSGRGYGLSFDNAAREVVNVTLLPSEAMEVLPVEVRAVLPPLYTTEKTGWNATAPVKLFTPDANWTWYPTEFDGDDLFFGLVSGNEIELGYFALSELEGVRGVFGLPIERDLYYAPTSIKELEALHNGTRRS